MRVAWLVMLLAPLMALSQENPADGRRLRLSLRRAVEMATSPEGSTTIQLSNEALRQAEARADQARAPLLPNLSGSFNVQSFTRNLAAFGIRPSTASVPGFPAFPPFVGPFTTLDARVTGSQAILDVSSIRRLQAARRNVSASRADIERADEQVAADVARAYLEAIRADADMEAARANVTLAEAFQKQAENQKEVGVGTGMEITRARVQVSDNRQRLLVAGNARRRAHLTLLRVMGLRLDTELELTDALTFTPVDDMTVAEATERALKTRPDLQAQEERESNARLSASATKMERMPTVSAFADYGPIGLGFDNWRPTRTYGLALDVPIFDGGRRDARRAESASQHRAESVRTHDLREQVQLEVRLALDSLRSAEEQVMVAREGLELAESESTQARRRYEAGVSISLEVTDALTRLERARENQTAALYNYNLARIDLSRALGTIRNSIQ